ncbi:MAG: YbaY family lipoprotein [Cellvibrionales bacterium]|nr:YbaY family lipoprotein [Cellvibrionales bacterium]
MNKDRDLEYDLESENPSIAAGVINGTADFSDGFENEQAVKLIIKLEDTSLADAASIKLSEITIDTFETVPIQFTIGFNPGDIKEGMSYSVSATLYSLDDNGNETMSHINTSNFPVLTNGFDNTVNLLLDEI